MKYTEIRHTDLLIVNNRLIRNGTHVSNSLFPLSHMASPTKCKGDSNTSRIRTVVGLEYQKFYPLYPTPMLKFFYEEGIRKASIQTEEIWKPDKYDRGYVLLYTKSKS